MKSHKKHPQKRASIGSEDTIHSLKPNRFLHVLSVFLLALLGAIWVSPARSQEPGTPIVLNTVWRDNLGTDLRMSTNNSTERDAHTIEGSVYYFANTNITGTTLMYRLFSSPDHMDSDVAGEGGYTTEGGIGYPWNSQLTGMVQVHRGYDSNSHHALISSNETLSGYTLEGFTLYAYPRYGDGTPTSTSPTHNLSLTAGGITIASNAVAGGAVWSLQWNGEEFINSHDYGRLLQTALNTDPGFDTNSTTYPGSPVSTNPTEAGASGYISGTMYHDGSPCISLSNSGNTQTSSCVPLDFAPKDWSGTNDIEPVIWQGLTLGKSVTLNYGSLGAVAKYVTQINLPVSLSTGSTYLPNTPQVFIPSLYLRSSFDTYYTYDPSTSTLTSLTIPSLGTATGVSLSSGQMAIIAKDSSTSNCLALYVVSTASGGSASGLGLFNFNDGSGTGASSNACYQIYADYHGAFSSGSSSYDSYIACGTLSNVESEINSLYTAGDK